MYAEGRTAPSIGVSGALGKQAHRRTRCWRTRSRTDEPAKRAGLADMARLSVARAAVQALTRRWNGRRGDSSNALAEQVRQRRLN